MSGKIKRAKTEEFFLSITDGEVSRIFDAPDNGEPLILRGKRIDSGEEVSVRLVEENEIEAFGMNPLNKSGSSWSRPTIREYFKRSKPARSFLALSKRDGSMETGNLTLKISSAAYSKENKCYVSRWIKIANGAGSLGLSNDTFLYAKGVSPSLGSEGFGLAMNVSRPFIKNESSKPLVFVSVASTDLTSHCSVGFGRDESIPTEDALRSFLSEKLVVAEDLRSKYGGSEPLVYISIQGGSSDNLRKYRYTPSFSTNKSSVLSLGLRDRGSEGFSLLSPKVAINNFIASREVKEALSIVSLNNMVCHLSATPAFTILYGTDSARKISDDKSDRRSSFFYSAFTLSDEARSISDDPGFNQGFLAIRKGEFKDLSYVTDCFLREKGVLPYSLSDVHRSHLSLYLEQKREFSAPCPKVKTPQEDSIDHGAVIIQSTR